MPDNRQIRRIQLCARFKPIKYNITYSKILENAEKIKSPQLVFSDTYSNVSFYYEYLSKYFSKYEYEFEIHSKRHGIFVFL